MSRVKSARVTPQIAGSPVYGKNELSASPGNIVYKHQGKYHVFNGTTKILVTEELQTALAEAAKIPATAQEK